MSAYDRYCEARDIKGVKDAHVAEATSIGRSTFSDWKNGRSVPKPEKLQKIADYLGVSVEWILTGESPTGYHYSNEAMEIAQEIYQNKDMHILFDMTRKASPDEIRDFVKMLEIMQKRERHEE